MIRQSHGGELVPIPAGRDVVRAGFDELPAIIRGAGERASWRFLEFFTANIRNKNTRQAYARAVRDFFRWCESRNVLNLEGVRPFLIAAYIEAHPGSAPTVKQHLAAIKMLFDWLVLGTLLMSIRPVPFAGRSMSFGAAKRRYSKLIKRGHF